MCLMSLEDKLPSLTLAVNDFDFRSLPRPEFSLISKSRGGWKEPFGANKSQFLFPSGCQKQIVSRFRYITDLFIPVVITSCLEIAENVLEESRRQTAEPHTRSQ
ncbi:hypothetical protein CEXT_375301 [Caerostris extrusa]|uniref:Uncharacterized protein n=1 Tax=Caerostris extrusa TaxID=172846 RepID=A0AAV4XGF7_CAEEX|nr:hypothetical protein CEXT_375301 [Caerostris extrusa]